MNIYIYYYILLGKNIEIVLYLVRGCYFQEGMEVKMEMRVKDAYKRSIETVLNWIHGTVDSRKTQVFFRTLAPVHFRFVSIS